MFNMAVILTLPRAQKHAFSSKAAGSPAAEAYPLRYVAGRWTTENEAGSHFQHAFSPAHPGVLRSTPSPTIPPSHSWLDSSADRRPPLAAPQYDRRAAARES